MEPVSISGNSGFYKERETFVPITERKNEKAGAYVGVFSIL